MAEIVGLQNAFAASAESLIASSIPAPSGGLFKQSIPTIPAISTRTSDETNPNDEQGG